MGVFKYAVVVLLTAIAIQYLPQWFHTLPVITGGHAEPGFERVVEIFREHMEKQPDKGVAFAAYYQGRSVVDLWGGYANSDTEQPWNENTMALVFSATKGVAAICVAMLVDRGHLDYDKPVATYWPEFAQNGKDKITVRQLMSHQAGLIYISQPITIEIYKDHKALGKILAAEKPQWKPGTKHGYHATTYGLYVSQLISHADPKGRTVGQFIEQELRKPYGIDFFVGLPLAENYRVANLYVQSIPRMIFDALSTFNYRYTTFFFGAFVRPTKYAANSMKNQEGLQVNWPEHRVIEQASYMGYGTARGLAKLYAILANGGKQNGKQVLSTKVIQELTKAVSKGPEALYGLKMNFGPGLGIGKTSEGDVFIGHSGHGGHIGGAAPGKNLAFGYLSNKQTIYGLGDDPIYLSLQQAVYDAVKKIEAT